MSRTIRRKGYSRELKWQTNELVWHDNTLVYVPLDRHSRRIDAEITAAWLVIQYALRLDAAHRRPVHSGFHQECI